VIYLASGGVGFALANVLLARAMSADAYGEVSLALSLVQLGASLGTLGLEITINRRSLATSRRLLAWALVSSSIVAAGVGGSAFVLYRISTGLMIALAIAAAAASVNRVGVAFLQSQERFNLALNLLQVPNYVLLAVVPVVYLLESDSSILVVAIVALGWAGIAVTGWSSAWRHEASPSEHPIGSLLTDALAGLGISVGVQFLWQLERLVIPDVLSMAELGTFSVVASVAGSPFRMIQIGIGQTLLPGLRACRNRQEVGRLLRHEGRVIAVTVGLSIVIAPAATMLISRYLLQGRYDITLALVALVVVTGLIKVWQGFASAVAQAFTSTAMLFRLTVLTWIGAAAGIWCAVEGVRFGLIGVVAGVGIGWLAVGLGATGLAISGLRAWSRETERVDPEHG
jgi:hypothetical protein